MMGTHDSQKDLFAYNIDLDKRVRDKHPLRRVRDLIDFKFVREEVEPLYGANGNESVDPEIVLKMMFLLFYEDSIKEIMIKN